MALIRPVVFVFQEFANPAIVATIPDLNALIVGPAYYLQDYFQPNTLIPADKDNIRLKADYGTLEKLPADTAAPTGAGVIVAADPPNNIIGALLDSTSVKVFMDDAHVVIASGVNAATVNGSEVVTITVVDLTLAANLILPGDRLILTDGAGKDELRTVAGWSAAAPTLVTVTADINNTDGGGFTPAGGQKWRVERTLNDQVLDSSFHTTTGNQIAINGSATLVANGVAKTVQYAKVYVQYRSLRQDLPLVDTVANDTEILAKIGRLDARNPLAVGTFVALQNTTSTIMFYGVTSAVGDGRGTTSDLLGQTACRDNITPRDDVYAVVPLTAEVDVLAMWNTNNVGLALPDQTKGRPQRFRAVLGSGSLPLTSTIGTKSTTAKTLQKPTGTAPTTINLLHVPGGDFITEGVVPTDVVTILLDSGAPIQNGTYTVAQVLSATDLQIDGAFPGAGKGALDVLTTFLIKDSTGVTTRRATATASSAAATTVGADLWLTLSDANGLFLSSGVIPGDVVQMPHDPDTDDYTTYSSFVVASVTSENRLLIVNNGVNTSTVQNELPHGVERVGGEAVDETGTLRYQIIRTLTKDQQITQLVGQAVSFSSSRCVLVWPDAVDVGGVVGGSSQVTGGAKQPGYYLSCAVGGMTAGLPSHQGFTFLGIAGIDRIYNSNQYFSDDQLTSLMQGGWYIFSQQTPTSLPFTIHQVTTDPSSLNTGEYSVVKNFDFVSLFFVDILSAFLGKYNIVPETLSFLHTAIIDGIDTLRLRTFPRIGAPLTSGELVSLAVSDTSADTVVIKMNVGLPKPLNIIELHLVG